MITQATMVIRTLSIGLQMDLKRKAISGSIMIFFGNQMLTAPRAKLRAEIIKLPQKPTDKQKLKVAQIRARLGKQVKGFLQAANVFLPTLEEVDLTTFKEEIVGTPADEAVDPMDLDVDYGMEGDCDFEEQDETETPLVLPEMVVLPLPSNIISVKVKSSIESLILVERELRKGQANDALEGIRVGLAHKSLIFLKDVNPSKTTKQSNRAWDSVRNTESQILTHAHSYQRAWQALNVIGMREDHIVYQKLKDTDLKTVKDITMVKRYGQGSDALAWFWRIGPGQDSLTGDWMKECK
jgi:hypothetical protein